MEGRKDSKILFINKIFVIFNDLETGFYPGKPATAGTSSFLVIPSGTGGDTACLHPAPPPDQSRNIMMRMSLRLFLRKASADGHRRTELYE